MTEQTFISSQRGRMIKIKINKTAGFITFHFSQEGGREFYSIPIKPWVEDLTDRLTREDNWHNHMAEKNWFSPLMENFINENTK